MQENQEDDAKVHGRNYTEGRSLSVLSRQQIREVEGDFVRPSNRSVSSVQDI